MAYQLHSLYQTNGMNREMILAVLAGNQDSFIVIKEFWKMAKEIRRMI